LEEGKARPGLAQSLSSGTQFIQDLIIEIVSKYDIDGIQFDDHFGLPVELGYDAFTGWAIYSKTQGKRPPIIPRP